MNYKIKYVPARNYNAVPQSHDLKISSFYQPSPVDGMLVQDVDNGDGSISHRLTSDIYMLFNQQRLDRMSRENLLNHFQSMAEMEPSFKSLKSRLSDDDLISIVKSRYIQSPSELLSYSRYLNSCAADVLNAAVASARARAAASVASPAGSAGAAAPVSVDSATTVSKA